jgi:HNH endonuclease
MNLGRKPPNFDVVERGDRFVQYAHVTDETAKSQPCSEVYGFYEARSRVSERQIGRSWFWVVEGEPISREGWISFPRPTRFYLKRKYHQQPIVPLSKKEYERFFAYYNSARDTDGVPFRFTRADLDLCSGTKSNSTLLRSRLVTLYDELLPKLKSDSVLRSFIEPTRPRNKLRTRSPYVPTYTRHGGGYKNGSWVGFADPIAYPNPRVGIQFQYGISRESRWYGIWVQGDQPTRTAERALFHVLKRYTPRQIASSINALGDRYWVEVVRDEDDETILDTSSGKVTPKHIEQFLINLERKRLWVSIDKRLSDSELTAIKDVPSDIIRTTHELLGVYRWLTGASVREMTEEEAYTRLKKGGRISIQGEGTVATEEREGIASFRVGQSAIRKYTLEIYGHQCALCDLVSDDLLRASHIVPWSEDAENRGNPRNVICLCSSHDILFERGLVRVNPSYNVEFKQPAEMLTKKSQMFRAIRNNTLGTIRLPSKDPPDPKLLEKKIQLLR